MKHLVHYLKDKIDLEILYKIDEENLIIFTDAVYANVWKFKSIIRFCALIADNSVIWTSCKQIVTAQSTTENEYMTLVNTVKQTIWLCHLLYTVQKLEIYEKKITIIYRNNKDFLNLIVNSVFHSWIKHIQIWYHAIQNYVEREEIQLQYIQINKMLADNFIKALNQIKFEQMIKRLDLINWLDHVKKQIEYFLCFCIDSSVNFSYSIQLLEIFNH